MLAPCYEDWENHITAHNYDTESAQEHVEQMGETQAKRIIPEMWEKAQKKLVRYFPDGDGRHDADLASALLYLVLAHSSQTLKGYTETGISKSCSRPIITSTQQKTADITAHVISKIDATLWHIEYDPEKAAEWVKIHYPDG
jgi:hypothetical protein